MMPAIERYLALRRAAGFRLSNAEYLLEMPRRRMKHMSGRRRRSPGPPEVDPWRSATNG